MANLADDHEFAKFKPLKYYFSNRSRDLKAQLTNYLFIDKLNLLQCN